jgi:hypothetical protein
MCSLRNFGLLNSNVTAIMATDPGFPLTLADCFVLTAHSVVQCTVPPGAGRGLAWTVTVADLASSVSISLSAYLPPRIVGLNGTSNLSTLGGETVSILGTDFGPAGGSLRTICAFSDSNLASVGFLAHPFGDVSCSVVSHEVAACTSVEAFGLLLRCARRAAYDGPELTVGARAGGSARRPLATEFPSRSRRRRRQMCLSPTLRPPSTPSPSRFGTPSEAMIGQCRVRCAADRR